MHPTTEPEVKLFSRLRMNGECWEWSGSADGKQYGMISVCGVRKKTHRLSYEIFKGKIPSGMVVMHSCDNTRCFNPDHLSVGTHQDNTDDKMRKKRHWTFTKTHCKFGHALTHGSFYLRKADNSRVCLVCSRERCREYAKTRVRTLKERKPIIKRTTCKRGHPYSHTFYRFDGRFQQVCNECQNIRYHLRKAATPAKAD